ncbi:hypothetical protein TWF281_008678 [Arthrobotrys megalospora]
MVCCPPELPNSSKKQHHLFFESSSDAIDALFSSARTSWPSGHYRRCTSNLSRGTFFTITSTIIPHITAFHIENTATDDDCVYVYYQFDTRSGASDDSADNTRGFGWGESGVHVYKCKDTETAERLFKEWLGALYPGWTPFPVDVRECGVGQYALEQDYGLVYWVRNNIFVKLDIDDRNITSDAVHRLALEIDEYLKAGSVLIGCDDYGSYSGN